MASFLLAPYSQIIPHASMVVLKHEILCTCHIPSPIIEWCGEEEEQKIVKGSNQIWWSKKKIV